MRVAWSVKAGVFGGVLVALGLVAYRVVRAPAIRDTTRAQIDRDLERASEALALTLPPGALLDPSLDVRVKAAGRAAGIRFTVIGENGYPVADSDVADVRAMA